MSREDHPARRGQLVWLAIILGLMANLSVHGFVASIGFAIVALALLRRKARAGRPVSKTGPAAILCCFWMLVFVTVFPPSDVDFPAGKNIQMSTQKIWAAFGSQTAKAELQQEKVEGLHPLPENCRCGRGRLSRRLRAKRAGTRSRASSGFSRFRSPISEFSR
jgi:hypothetical protein